MAVLTLALGIGATTAIFSVVNGALLQPPPFRDPSRLVAVLETRALGNSQSLLVSPEHFEEWARRNSVFEGMSAVFNCYFRTENNGDPHLVTGACASANLFPMLGVKPILGRAFNAEEDRPGNNTFVMLSYGYWQSQFHGDPNVIGKTLRRTATNAEYSIIGVHPPEFQLGSGDYSVWAPYGDAPRVLYRDEHAMLAFA